MRVESFISSSVLPNTARERVIKVFAVTWTQKIVLPHPISRLMHLGVLVGILLRQHSKISNPKDVMDRYLQRSLAKVNNQSIYLTEHILLKKSGELCNFFWFCGYLRNFRAHIARWCAKNNRPHQIVKDRHFEIIMIAGRPGTTLPSSRTVSRDITVAFKVCCEHINDILKVSF